MDLIIPSSSSSLPPVSLPTYISPKYAFIFSQPDGRRSHHSSSWPPFVFPLSRAEPPSNCEPVTLPEPSLHPTSGDGPFLAEATGHCWAVGHYWTSKGPCFWPTPAASLQPLLTGQRVILGSLVYNCPSFGQEPFFDTNSASPKSIYRH